MPLNIGRLFSSVAKSGGAVMDDRRQRQAQEQASQERLEDRLAQKEMRDLQKRSLEQALQPPKPKDVEWDTRETPDGLMQVNPITGEARPVSLEGRVLQGKPKEDSWQIDPERGVRINRSSGAVEPIQGLPKATPKPPSEAQQMAQESRKLDRTRDLRADYQKDPTVTGSYGVAKVAQGIKGALAGDTPMDDLALVYETVKLFDPNSAVREGEIKLFQSAASLPLQVRMMVDRWNKGRLLTPGMRAHIAQLVDRKVQGSRDAIAPVQADFGKMARDYGVQSDSAYIAPDPFRGVRSSKRSALPNP